MNARTRTIAGAVSLALACGVGGTAAQAAQAAESGGRAPQAQAAGLLDGLGNVLGGLLGSGGSQPLENLLGALTGGQTPTAGLLQPVHDLLDQLASTPGLPPAVADLIRDVADLLGGTPSGEPLDPALLGPLETLLRDLAGSAGLPPTASNLLNQIAGLLGGAGGDGTLGLPVDLLRILPQTIDELDGLISSLIDGERPTGALLEPVARLLDEVAASVPGSLNELLREVAALVRGTSGELDPLLVNQLRRLLVMIGNTPGVTREQRSVIERVTTVLTQAAASNNNGNTTKPAILATKRDRAVVKRVNVDPSRNRVGLRVECPKRAPATCVVRVSARFAGRKAANPKSTRIGAGRSKVVRLRLLKQARSASIRRGGKLRITVATRFGTQRFSYDKVVKLPRLKKARS